jgi:hypothetical protein
MVTLLIDTGILVGGFLFLGLVVAVVLAVIDEAITNRPSPTQRAQAKVDRHAVQRSRRDAELRAGLHGDAQEVRRQLRRELGDR